MSPLRTDDAEQIVDLFKHVQRLFRQQIMENPELKQYTFPQIILIKVLMDHPGITLTDLSERMSLAKSTVSGIVDRLEEQGLVIRERPIENKRIVSIKLSTKCLSKTDFFKKMKETYVREFLQNATDDEVKRIIDGLQILNRLMAPK